VGPGTLPAEDALRGGAGTRPDGQPVGLQRAGHRATGRALALFVCGRGRRSLTMGWSVPTRRRRRSGFSEPSRARFSSVCWGGCPSCRDRPASVPPPQQRLRQGRTGGRIRDPSPQNDLRESDRAGFQPDRSVKVKTAGRGCWRRDAGRPPPVATAQPVRGVLSGLWTGRPKCPWTRPSRSPRI
jgi:hypothetical protein